MIKSLVGIELQIDRPRIDGGKCIPHVFHFNSTSTLVGISDCFMGALACTIVVSSNDALSTDLHELVPRVIPITYVTCVTLFFNRCRLVFRVFDDERTVPFIEQFAGHCVSTLRVCAPEYDLSRAILAAALVNATCTTYIFDTPSEWMPIQLRELHTIASPHLRALYCPPLEEELTTQLLMHCPFLHTLVFTSPVAESVELPSSIPCHSILIPSMLSDTTPIGRCVYSTDMMADDAVKEVRRLACAVSCSDPPTCQRVYNGMACCL